MDMYGKHSKSIPQKSLILISELLLLWLSFWILFRDGGQIIFGWLGIEEIEASRERKLIIFCFSLVVFLRVGYMMLFFLKRRIPWEESISIPLAFALYYVGFSLLVLPSEEVIGLIDYIATGIFFLGSVLNTGSEWQRHQFKRDPLNKGKLYTGGLFKYSMHMNFFGDLLWVTGYALITRNWYSALIVLFLLCFFVFYNVPKLDAYLSDKYGNAFKEYAANTKKLIPYIY